MNLLPRLSLIGISFVALACASKPSPSSELREPAAVGASTPGKLSCEESLGAPARAGLTRAKKPLNGR